jgi:o-succinylbenzoate---CoA ligase
VSLPEGLVRGSWIRGSGAGIFERRLAEEREKAAGRSRCNLVAAEDPVTFLAAVLASLLEGRPVALANHAWGPEEWRQVGELNLAGTAKGTGQGEAEPPECPPLRAGEILIPTGGSGGRVRFARHNWDTLAAAAEGFTRFFGGSPVHSVCVLPLFHVSGLMQVIRAWVSGGTVELIEWRELASGALPESAADEGGILSLVPTQLRRLLTVKELHPWMRRLQAIPLGGAAAGADLLAAAARMKLPVALTYGATETAAMAAAQEPLDFLGGDRTSGHPLPHLTVRIAGPAGEDLSAGAVGRIHVAGRSLFTGYIPGGPRNEPEWISGDLGFLDQRGRLVVVGREDRVVISGGEKISPEEVERVLLESGRVADAVVLGLDHSDWGQIVAAVYVAEGPVTKEDLAAWVRCRLAPHKVPKVWRAVETIPRSAQGKVKREQLAAMLRTAEST